MGEKSVIFFFRPRSFYQIRIKKTCIVFSTLFGSSKYFLIICVFFKKFFRHNFPFVFLILMKSWIKKMDTFRFQQGSFLIIRSIETWLLCDLFLLTIWKDNFRQLFQVGWRWWTSRSFILNEFMWHQGFVLGHKYTQSKWKFSCRVRSNFFWFFYFVYFWWV